MTDTRRVVIRGSRFQVARIMADVGIPFAFVREAGPNTVGDIGAQFVGTLAAFLHDHPECEGRFARSES